MESSERRRDIRAHASPPLHILRIGTSERVEVLNVSYRGLFLRMDEPPPMNELLRVRVELPSSMVIEANVVTVRTVVDAQGRSGVGVKFFVLGGEEKRAWESYIASLVQPRRVAA